MKRHCWKRLFHPQEFLGNLVENIITKHHLVIPVKARLIQFQPVEMVSSVCMRVELYGEKSAVENTGKCIELLFSVRWTPKLKSEGERRGRGWYGRGMIFFYLLLY